MVWGCQSTGASIRSLTERSACRCCALGPDDFEHEGRADLHTLAVPVVVGAVVVYTTLAVPGIMLTESTLSFIGLGVKAPNSSWGTLIKEGADRLEVAPGLLLFPAAAFCLTLLALNFLGDGLRDAIDPRAGKD